MNRVAWISSIISLLLLGCEGIYVIQGKVCALNGEPLPGVSISNPHILNHTITNSRGEYTLRITKPINMVQFIKSDYLIVQVPIDSWSSKRIVLDTVMMMPKPTSTGIFVFNEKKCWYTPLTRSKVEKIPVDNNNFTVGVRIANPVKVESSLLNLYGYGFPSYNISCYQLKEYVPSVESEKKDDKKEKKKENPVDKQDNSGLVRKIYIPKEPILIYTEFVSDLDRSLYKIKSVNELKSGMYCINWGVFENLYSQITEVFVFEVLPSPEVPQLPSDAEVEIQKDNQGTNQQT